MPQESIASLEANFEFGEGLSTAIIIGRGPIPFASISRAVIIQHPALQPVHAYLVRGVLSDYYYWYLAKEDPTAMRAVKDGDTIELAPRVLLTLHITERAQQPPPAQDEDEAATLPREPQIQGRAGPPPTHDPRIRVDRVDPHGSTSVAGPPTSQSRGPTGRAPRTTTPEEGAASARLGAQAQRAQGAQAAPRPQVVRLENEREIPPREPPAPRAGSPNPERKAPQQALAAWLKRHSERMIISLLVIGVGVLSWRVITTHTPFAQPATSAGQQQTSNASACVPITSQLAQQHLQQGDVTRIRRVDTQRWTAKVKCDASPTLNEDGTWNVASCQICPFP